MGNPPYCIEDRATGGSDKGDKSVCNSSHSQSLEPWPIYVESETSSTLYRAFMHGGKHFHLPAYYYM